ncbi:LysE family transporter [Helicobacter sp. MIT 05-5294]|uniref:LysE family transporter n=1 Tax=Helicobacter sp. MIT 05-5294 TaxID=1548150 RepID=UPI0010FDF956|nr:LysE family transporter [Helicobacter sp. MIT 05-5294]TLD87237.1 lysine transporter LysE [Helicobacter sp. MIT 05-5294]
MDESAFLSFLLYAVITAITPGPNNILALNAMISYERKDAKILILGIYVGFAIMMIVFGFGSAILGALLESINDYLKYLSALYVLYIAYKVVRSRAPVPVDSKLADSQTNAQKNVKSTNNNIGFFGGMVLQFVNIKAALYAITIQSAFVLPYHQNLSMSGFFVLLSIIINFVGIFLWVIGGAVFCEFLQKYYKPVNFTMAFLLFLSAVQILIG